MTRCFDRTCLVCGERVALLLFPRRGGGCVSIGGGWAVCSADARTVAALCDKHFNVWVHSPLARMLLAYVHETTRKGVGITPYGFKLIARVVGKRPRVLWRQIVRERAQYVKREKRKRNRHDYIASVLFLRYMRKHPWVGAILGHGLLTGYIASAYFGVKKAA